MGHQIDSIARLIGNAYAHVQDGMDRAIEWGFKQVEEQAKTSPRKASKKPRGVVGNAAAFARGFFSVIGEAGSAYYTTYNQLKKKRQ